MDKDLFCSLPFTEIFLGPNGDIKTCCSSNIPLGNLQNNNINEILQNNQAKEVRQFIINNKWHPQCSQCKHQEEQGVRSERVSSNNSIKEFLPLTKDTFKLRRVDLRWSNTCNLACMYCYEYFSSQWSSIKGIKVNTINQQNEDSLFNFLEDSLKESSLSESVIMLGGEPLLQKQNSRLIELLSGHGFYILTNLSVPLRTNKIAQQLLLEENCRWGVSFETIGKRYEYVRHGASWETFVDNIDYYHSQIPHDNYRLEAHSLYSIYSAFNLVEFYEFIVEKQFQTVFWNMLESSGTTDNVNVLNLSDELKRKAINEIERCEEKFPNAPGINALSNIKNLLMSNANQRDINKDILIDVTSTEAQLKKTIKFETLWPDLYKDLQC